MQIWFKHVINICNWKHFFYYLVLNRPVLKNKIWLSACILLKILLHRKHYVNSTSTTQKLSRFMFSLWKVRYFQVISKWSIDGTSVPVSPSTPEKERERERYLVALTETWWELVVWADQTKMFPGVKATRPRSRSLQVTDKPKQLLQRELAVPSRFISAS